jgi:uncharacterized protein YegJ (DUF2314 family)
MIEALIGIVIVGSAVALFWKLIRPEAGLLAPLEAPADDKELADARRRAQENIAEFVTRYKERPEGCLVKVPFVSSTGVTEHLVASVLQLYDESIIVRIDSTPVTHRGDIERVQRFRLSELSDWVVTMPSGRKRGGYTLQVQLARRKASGDTLLPELAAEEQLYDWDRT